MKKNITSWIIRLVAAVILLQTLFYKFSGAPASVEIFTILEMEPNGRILIGVLELATAILILIPQSVGYGALLGTGLMSGAIIGHMTKLGWSGEMFSLGMLAVIVFALCLATLALHKEQIPLVSRVIDSK